MSDHSSSARRGRAFLVPALVPVLAAVLGAARAGPAQQGGTPADLVVDLPGADVHDDLLALKLSDVVEVEVQGGAIASRAGVDVAALQALLAAADAVRPMITCLPRRVLDAWHARAVAVAPPGRAPGHLASWLYVQCRSGAVARALRDRLREQPLVEHCYLEPIATPASPMTSRGRAAAPPATARSVWGGDPLPPTPSFTHLQQNLDAPPLGTDLRRAHGVLGCRGRGVKLRMVEEDWYVDHEDIDHLALADFLGVPPPGNTIMATHGTAGTSLLVADRNGFGLTGAADELDIRYIAFIGNGGFANSMVWAAADADPGDVVLMIVMFLWGQLGPTDWVPMELIPGVYDVVRTVTSNGRIVVATAANGGRSLDDPRFLGAFDRTVRDSGAIMVGASAGGPLGPSPVSNFGAICDSSCWGSSVVAAGFGDLFFGNNDRRQAYTATYQGTSSSVPIVAAVVAALQGGGRRQLGRDFTATELRQLLRAHATPVAGQVGDRPDLGAMLAATGIADGLELAAPDTGLGSQVQVDVTGASATGGAMLFASLGTGDTPIGLNRNLHLDLAATTTLDFKLLAAGRAAFQVTVPNHAALAGVQLYLQAAVLPAAGPIHVTNSGHLSVL